MGNKINKVGKSLRYVEKVRKGVPFAFEEFRKYIKKDMQICVPAMIVEYNRTTHLATVLPLSQYAFYNQQDQVDHDSRVPFENIRVHFIACGGVSMDFPLYRGDTGWLISSDWKTGLLKQRGALTSSVLYKERKPEDVLEEENNEFCEKLVEEETHYIQDGFFIPDSWGDFPHEQVKDLVEETFNKQASYLGTPVSDEDKYQKFGDYHYPRHMSCHLSVSPDGKLTVAQSLPKRNHTQVQMDLYNGGVEVTARHTKKNRDEVVIPIESDELKKELDELKAAEPGKWTVEESKKTTHQGETGVSGIDKDWKEWHEKVLELETKLEQKYMEEDEEEKNYDYSNEEDPPIKVRETKVTVTPTKAHLEVSYKNHQEDDEEDPKKGEGEPVSGEASGDKSKEQPWTKKSEVDLTPLKTEVKVTYDNPLEQKTKSALMTVRSGATDKDDKLPEANLELTYVDANASVTDTANVTVEAGDGESVPSLKSTLLHTDGQTTKLNLIDSVVDEEKAGKTPVGETEEGRLKVSETISESRAKAQEGSTVGAGTQYIHIAVVETGDKVKRSQVKVATEAIDAACVEDEKHTTMQMTPESFDVTTDDGEENTSSVSGDGEGVRMDCTISGSSASVDLTGEKATVQAEQQVDVTAGNSVTVKGGSTVTIIGPSGISMIGDVSVSGTLTADDCIGGGKSLAGHTHRYTTPEHGAGEGSTSSPQ